MTYTLTDGSVIIRDNDGANIPADTRNVDYRDYLDWVDKGGTPNPYMPPAPPDELSAWDKVSAKILFNHENRIRAFEGKQPITAAQFKAAVKNLASI